MNVDKTKLSKLKKLTGQIERISNTEDPDLSFEFLTASLFPNVYKNVQESIRDARTQGFIDGSLGDDWIESQKGIKATILQPEIEGLADILDKALDEVTEMVSFIDDEKQHPIPLPTEQEELFINLVLPRLTSIIKICQAALFELHLKEGAEDDN